MKISHKLILLIVVTGLGYLGVTISYNQLYKEAIKQTDLATDIQNLHNSLKLVRLELNTKAPKNSLTKTINAFTSSAKKDLNNYTARLPIKLQPLALKISDQLDHFNDAFISNQQHTENLRVLTKHFKSHSKRIGKYLLKQCRLLEEQIPNNAIAAANYITLQTTNSLVSRYSSLTIENLLIDNNIPSFEANQFLIQKKLLDEIAKIINMDNSNHIINRESLQHDIEGLLELSQRIAIELKELLNTQTKLNITEKIITEALIDLENKLKKHINTTTEKLGNYYNKATLILILILVLVLVSALIGRSIFSPLKKILSFSKQLTQGNYDTQISTLPPGEFEEIGEAFNEMATKIKSSQEHLEEQVNIRTQQLTNSNTALKAEIAEREKVESILKDLASTVLTRKGEQYFASFTRYLTIEMGFDYAFISKIIEKDSHKYLKTLSFNERGIEQENISYPIQDTPCELVVANKQFYFPQKIQKLFPKDDFLSEYGIESYIGAPIIDQNNNILGVISVLSQKPISSPEPALSILQIFVSQIGAEIERSQQDMALKVSEERNRILVDNAPEAIIILDLETGLFTLANPNAIRLFGLPTDQLYRSSPADVSPEYQPNGERSDAAAMRYIQKAIDGETPVFEWQHKNADGELIDCEVRLVLFPSADRLLVRGSITDITERKKTQAEMLKLSHALAQAADAAIVTNIEGVIEYANAACEKMTGFSQAELIGQTPRIFKSGKMEPLFFKKLWETINQGDNFTDIFINKRKDGSIYYEEKTITPLKDDTGKITHFISTGKDITERIQTEKRLHHLAYHDPLTDLPNRSMLTERIQHAIENASRSKRILGVMFLDVDRFKNINDTLGHDVGDKLLVELAARIQNQLRTSDTIARLGGDEFAILIEWAENANDLSNVAKKLIESFRKPFNIDGNELFTTASIGISIYPDNGKDSTTLLKNADVAMYRAKEQGRDCYHFYSEELTTKAYERLSIENKLRRALDQNELELFYQPQVLRPSNIVCGLEALLRWRDPDKGLVSPAEFIPVLEETGMIISVGEWVLETACRDHKEWESLSSLPLLMSVNLSSKQFEDPSLGNKILNILSTNNYDPKLLELEITESALMSEPKRSVKLLKELSYEGIRFAVDDFGTGYSSLSYLKQFPIKTLKIDRSFVQDITVDPDDEAIISAIIALAQSLGLEVIAEGVETLAQVKYLEQYQCQKLQGFLYSKPMPKDECFKFLLENEGIIDPKTGNHHKEKGQ